MLNQLEELRETLYRFIETRISLLEVETRGYLERIILQLVYFAVVMLTTVIVITFLLILLSVYLNRVLESTYAGYLIVSGFFGVGLVLLITLRESCLSFIRWALEKALGEGNDNQTN